jgi:hypothetical protein
MEHTFETVGIVFSVPTAHTELSGTLFRIDDLEGRQDVLNANDRFARLICSRNGDIQITDRHQFRRHVLQLDDIQQFELFA